MKLFNFKGASQNQAIDLDQDDFAETSDQNFDEVHTPENPYCSYADCWCHFSVEYHDQVQHPHYSGNDVARARSFFGLGR